MIKINFKSRSIWRDEAKKYEDENPESNQTSFWGNEERFFFVAHFGDKDIGDIFVTKIL